MKLSKDEIQKVGLAGLLLAGVVYCYFTMLLGPLARKQVALAKTASELAPRIVEARKQIAKTQQLEKQAPVAVDTLDSINGLIPEGAPVAWFPPRMVEFFKRQGIDKATARLTNEYADKEFTGYRKLAWSVDLPKAEFVSTALAIAGLENEEPLLEVNNIQIDSIKDDPQYQHVLLSVGSIAKQ